MQQTTSEAMSLTSWQRRYTSSSNHSRTAQWCSHSYSARKRWASTLYGASLTVLAPSIACDTKDEISDSFKNREGAGFTYKLPSPMNRIVLPNPKSLAANAAPNVLPTVHPMLPHNIWPRNTEPLGSGTSIIPKALVPVSATTTSPALKNLPIRGQM